MPGEKIPLLARAVGGRVLGPRPGLAIVSFWQGILEIVFRSVAFVLGVLTIIPAAVAVAKLHNTDNSNTDVALAGCYVVVALGVVGALLETVLIIVRFVNIGIINMKFMIFGFVDVALALVVSILFLVGTILTGYSAHQQSTINNGVGDAVAPLGAAAGLCFFSMVAFTVQGVWMLIFVILKWNKHVVTYTLKDAILS